MRVTQKWHLHLASTTHGWSVSPGGRSTVEPAAQRAVAAAAALLGAPLGLFVTCRGRNPST